VNEVCMCTECCIHFCASFIKDELHETSNSHYFSLLYNLPTFPLLFPKSFETDNFVGSGSVCCIEGEYTCVEFLISLTVH
jgi:hypothetical protein